ACAACDRRRTQRVGRGLGRSHDPQRAGATLAAFEPAAIQERIMNIERIRQYVADAWDRSIVPALCEYIRIPNKSIHFDPNWKAHGHMDRAAQLMREWCEANALA